MDIGDNEPCYVISIAARMVGVQVHTLRYYERVGIVEPSRSKGNTRLYSESDIALLRRAKALMDELGINLAGAEVFLRMSQRISEMQSYITELESEIRQLRGGE